MNPQTASKHAPPHTLIAFATYWGSKFGGINSFNADLVEALGLTFYRDMRVFCVVLDADESDIPKAEQSHHVKVISLRRPNDKAFSTDSLEEVKAELVKCGCTPGPDTVWLGHDRITGDIAVKAVQKMGGRSALIHHMSYADYETFAEGAEKAREKEDEQEALFLKGDVLFAVGPVLRNALQDMVEHAVTMLIPGLHEIDAAAAPNTFTGFLSGRINEKTHRIKQAHLGVAGFARATARANTELHLPESLKSSRNPCLKVRGLDESNAATGTDPETDLKRFAESYAGGVINLRALPFTIHREEAFKELRKASVALMPSWHEGFGLVAWEAIAAGVPLILSKKSGVYHLLGELDGGVYQSLVIPIDVRGQVDEPYFHPDDLKSVADAIIQVANDPQKARGKASQLREMLLQRGCTWKSCADTLVKALGWEPSCIPDNLPATPPPPVDVPVSESAPPSATDDLLDLPVPQWSPGKGLANSQLLRAEEAVIPFDAAAQPFLDEQLTWAKDPAFPLALRLLIGPGGSGKTRLALQLCTQLRGDGWWTGFLRRPAQFTQIHARLKAAAQPVLIVMDYAETRIDDLLTLIKPLILSPVSQPVRILLLARSGGDWWDRMDGRDPQCEAFFAGYATSGPYSIPELHATPASREAAFQQALHLFSAKLSLPVPSHSPDLTAEHYAHPLLVQMAALLALHDEQPSTAEGLTRSLVNHEKRYWGHLLKGDAEVAEQAAQLMALSTLYDGLQTPREIEPIWKESDCGTGAELKAAFNQLKILYPHKGGLQSLRPDLLGEALVTQVLLSSQGPDILNAVLAKAEERIRHHVWTVLARILRQRADLMPVVQEALAGHYLQNAKNAAVVCCQTPGPLSEVMLGAYRELASNLKLKVSERLLPLFSEDLLPLNDLYLCIAEACLKSARQKFLRASPKKAMQERAALVEALYQTSVALQRCGDLEAALRLASECEKNARILAKFNLPQFEGEWAAALNNYANCLSENGQSRESLEIMKKSLGIFERLAQNKSEVFEANWAAAMQNYAIRLNEIGQVKEALRIAEDSLHLCKRLKEGKPEVFTGDWAKALIVYANCLSENGRFEEALEPAQEAFDVYKNLAQDQPEAFKINVAMVLNNYANRLSENGFSKEALNIGEESLKIYKQLAHSKPERFEGDLAIALHNYANRLSENGANKKALEMAKDSLEIYERLAQGNQVRYESKWGAALNNYAVRLNETGNYPKALILIKRASEINHRLVEKLPMKHGCRYKAGILNECFVTWLCGSEAWQDILHYPIALAAVEHSQFESSAMAFIERSVFACLDVNVTTQLGHAINALHHWSQCNATQQRRNEEMFFLISAMLEKVSETNSAVALPPPEWRARYEAMVKRRRGNIPAWLLDAAKKLGLQLPAVSLTPLALEASTQAAIQAVEVPDASVCPEHL